MTDPSTAARALVSRSWADTTPEERQARTRPALLALNRRYRAIVDPHGRLPDAVAAELIRELRAEQLRANIAKARAEQDTP